MYFSRIRQSVCQGGNTLGSSLSWENGSTTLINDPSNAHALKLLLVTEWIIFFWCLSKYKLYCVVCKVREPQRGSCKLCYRLKCHLYKGCRKVPPFLYSLFKRDNILTYNRAMHMQLIDTDDAAVNRPHALQQSSSRSRDIACDPAQFALSFVFLFQSQPKLNIIQ